MTDRRDFLGALSLTIGAGLAVPANGAESAGRLMTPSAGARLPQFEFVYECDVTLADPLAFGKTVEGQRRIIPITGGRFQGPQLRGEVVSGGADWNLQRSDGAGNVEAAYYLRTEDSVLIRIVNKGVGDSAAVADDARSPERFFMFTTPSFEAPTGKYDWVNRAMFVGTLGARKDARNAVLIRVFKLV